MKLIEASTSNVAFKHLEFSFCILLFWVLPIDLAFEGWTPVEHFPGFSMFLLPLHLLEYCCRNLKLSSEIASTRLPGDTVV